MLNSTELRTRLLCRRSVLAMTIALTASTFMPLLSSCSVVMAARQPSKKDLGLLAPGTERDLVIAEFGAPVTSEPMPDGGRKEIYTFIQGYSTGAKVSRAVFHSAADVLSLGLWEAAGTPIEATFDGKKITVRVIFDHNDRIVSEETVAITKP